MPTHTPYRAALATVLFLCLSANAGAQGFDLKGYGLVGSTTFAATESFEAVTGSASGPVFGGGVEVGLPLGGLYVGVGGWRFEEQGERVFVSGSQVFPLGIPVTVQVSPIEVTGGWRFKNLSPRLVPYAGAGWSSYAYKEVSSFAAAGEDVDERFSGFHILGGAEFRIARWLGVGGEVAWARVPDALGRDGVSQAFEETDLGGTSFRLKISIGR
jgi:hypothetical protein